jgi:hypothetical protein
MRSRLFHIVLCLMLVLQGLPMSPVARASVPCAAMPMHAGMTMPGSRQMAGAMPGMDAPAIHGPAINQAHDLVLVQRPGAHAQPGCLGNCSLPCQQNVPVALLPMTSLVLPQRPIVRSPAPRPLHYAPLDDSIQRPPIA